MNSANEKRKRLSLSTQLAQDGNETREVISADLEVKVTKNTILLQIFNFVDLVLVNGSNDSGFFHYPVLRWDSHPILCLYFPQVSWVRHENSHILTAGRYKYTSDERFQPIHPENSNDWLLRIRRVQKSDQGRYECQINTKDHKSYPFNLKVVGKRTVLQETLDGWRSYLWFKS